MLSTSFLYEEQPFYDLMPLASLLCMEGAAGAQEILAAMTLRPARALKLSGKRGIRKGADADMIVFQARDLEELFCSFGRQALHRHHSSGSAHLSACHHLRQRFFLSEISLKIDRFRPFPHIV